MNKNGKLGLVLLAGIMILCGTWGYENAAKKELMIPTMAIPIDKLDQIGEFWITVPALENRGLDGDVNGVTFEGDQDVYLIVPSDIDEKKVVFYIRDTHGDYATRVDADFTSKVQIAGRQIHLVKSQLPIMFIKVEQYQDFQNLLLAETKEPVCNGDMYLSVSKEDAQRNGWAEETISVENDHTQPKTMFLRARGNGTWVGKQKKPFTLCMEKSTELLGMGKNKKWNLLANSVDRSLLKNYIFGSLASDIGMEFVPQMQNIVLFVNGNYQGVYLLTTKVSVDKNRVNLSKKDFLVNWGGTNPQQVITYKSDTWFYKEFLQSEPYVDLIYPEEDKEIEEKQQIIQRFISSIEDVNSDEYLKYMDMDSMVRYYWVQEASMNYDAPFRSTYSYYRENTGKMYMGPIWDMDLTLGIRVPKHGVSFYNPEGWKIRQWSWYVPLFQHKEFADAVKKAYFEGGVREGLMKSIEDFEKEKDHLSVDGEMNFRFWDYENEPFTFHYDVSSYEEYVDKVIEFYKQRIAWIDQQMQQE